MVLCDRQLQRLVLEPKHFVVNYLPVPQRLLDKSALMSQAANLKAMYTPWWHLSEEVQDLSSGQTPQSWEKSGSQVQAMATLVLPHSSAEKLDKDMDSSHLVNG